MDTHNCSLTVLEVIFCFCLLLFTSVQGANLDEQIELSDESWEQIYKNDFSADNRDGMFVLGGDFKIAESEYGPVLVLPGEPLGDFGVLFGPRHQDSVAVRARILSNSMGRRMPAFSIGLNGRSGYRIRVSASAKAVELLKGNEVYATAPFKWSPESWTWLHLQVVKASKKRWIITGKVWLDGSSEPPDWIVQMEDLIGPQKGRASIWGMPFSGKDILFDDVSIYLKRVDEE